MINLQAWKYLLTGLKSVHFGVFNEGASPVLFAGQAVGNDRAEVALTH